MDYKHSNPPNNETAETPLDKGELEQKKVEEASEIHHQSKTPKKWNTILAPEPKPLCQVLVLTPREMEPDRPK